MHEGLRSWRNYPESQDRRVHDQQETVYFLRQVCRSLPHEGYGYARRRHYYQVHRLRHLREGMSYGSFGNRGKVILKTRETKNEIEISIIDDGVGFEPKALEKERSVGVRNVRYRLERMVNGRLEIESVIGKGTQVTIYLPKGNRI